MVQRRVADLWRQAAGNVSDTVNWADLYRSLLDELTSMSAEGGIPDSELRAGLADLRREPPTASPARAGIARAGAPDRGHPPSAIPAGGHCPLPWQATGDHPVIESLAKLRDLYARNARSLPDGFTPARIGLA